MLGLTDGIDVLASPLLSAPREVESVRHSRITSREPSHLERREPRHQVSFDNGKSWFNVPTMDDVKVHAHSKRKSSAVERTQSVRDAIYDEAKP